MCEHMYVCVMRDRGFSLMPSLCFFEHEDVGLILWIQKWWHVLPTPSLKRGRSPGFLSLVAQPTCPVPSQWENLSQDSTHKYTCAQWQCQRLLGCPSLWACGVMAGVGWGDGLSYSGYNVQQDDLRTNKSTASDLPGSTTWGRRLACCLSSLRMSEPLLTVIS